MYLNAKLYPNDNSNETNKILPKFIVNHIFYLLFALLVNFVVVAAIDKCFSTCMNEIRFFSIFFYLNEA